MTTTIEPVRKEIRIAVPRDEAFRRFTAGIDTWWPKATHSVFGDGCRRVVMEPSEGGRVYEVGDEGEESEWGVVTTWDAPRRVVFTWHPGRGRDTRQEVDVRFEEADGGTRVTLVHSGWERLGEGAGETRDQYVGGWDFVLGKYAAQVAAG